MYSAYTRYSLSACIHACICAFMQCYRYSHTSLLCIHTDHHPPQSESQTNSQIATIETCTSTTCADIGSQVSNEPLNGWIVDTQVKKLELYNTACYCYFVGDIKGTAPPINCII